MICLLASTDSVLLAHLAATSWFAQHGEVALTAGLAFCRQKDDVAAEAFVRMLRTRTELSGDDLPTPTRWQAEKSDADRGRIDIAGLFRLGRACAPVVQVEAKVTARLGSDQLAAYVASQLDRTRSRRFVATQIPASNAASHGCRASWPMCPDRPGLSLRSVVLACAGGVR